MSKYGKLFLYSFFAMVGASAAHAMMYDQVVPEQRAKLTKSESQRVVSDTIAYMHSDDYRKRVKEAITWTPEVFYQGEAPVDDMEGDYDLEVHLKSKCANAQHFILARYLQTYRLPPTPEEQARGLKEGILIPEGELDGLINNPFSNILDHFLFNRASFPFASQQEVIRSFISNNSKRIVFGSLRKDLEGSWVVTIRPPQN